MYAYAFVAYLDSESEKTLVQLWKELSKNNISQYGVESKGKRPHITIADYDDLDKERFINLLNKFYDDKSKIEVTLNALGTFVNSGTLFISPTLSKELSEFHGNHHSYFKGFNKNENSFYLPGIWNPHCTIASRLSKDNMVSAFEYCLENLGKIKGEICEVALIEIKLNDNGISIEDTIIFSKKL